MRSFKYVPQSHHWGLILVIIGFIAMICCVPVFGHEGLRGGGFEEKVSSAICIVKSSERPLGGNSPMYYGTGTFLSDTLVLTCYHNIRDEHKNPGTHKLEVLTKLGNVLRVTHIGKVNQEQDLCLLIVEPGYVHTTMSVTDDVNLPDKIQTIGFDPKYMMVRVYEGLVDKEEPLLGRSKTSGPIFYQHRSKTVQGMSGGPVVDVLTGKICGVQVSSDLKPGGLSQAVLPIKIQGFLDRYTGPVGIIK